MENTLPPIFSTLGEILATAPSIAFGYALYLPDEEWTLSTRAALLSPDDVESEDQDEPLAAARAGLRYALDGGTVTDIYENLRGQGQRCEPEQLLRAFLHYYDHDAFIRV